MQYAVHIQCHSSGCWGVPLRLKKEDRHLTAIQTSVGFAQHTLLQGLRRTAMELKFQVQCVNTLDLITRKLYLLPWCTMQRLPRIHHSSNHWWNAMHACMPYGSVLVTSTHGGTSDISLSRVHVRWTPWQVDGIRELFETIRKKNLHMKLRKCRLAVARAPSG